MSLVGVPKDPYEEFLKANFPDERLQTWLWHFLRDGNANFAMEVLGPADKKGMGSYLMAYPTHYQTALRRKGGGFLSNDKITWIKDDAVQVNFLKIFLRNEFRTISPDIHESIGGRRHVVTFLDCAVRELTYGVDLVNRAKTAWAHQVESNRIFDWFEGKEGAPRREFFWDWMRRKFPKDLEGRTDFSDHRDLLMFFDSSNFQLLEKREIVRNVRLADSQRRYKQSLEGKKQYNFILSDESNQILNELARRRKTSRTEVIEYLIKESSEKGLDAVD